MIFLLVMMTAACTRAASQSQPTEPALNFPTLSPNEVPLCQPADLQTSSNSNGDASGVVMGMTLTNQSKQICKLSNPPQTRLLDASNKPLELVGVDTAPAMTPPASDVMQIAPGENTIVTLVWQNYCQPAPVEPVIVRLELEKDQNLDIAIHLSTVPGCQDKKKPSTISVAPYSAPP